ncbi:class I SAM-dependent methyltransferase [Amorphus orientalis]|uniref:SAM-dependent methyltransferase n=1 Tax=Amorphus orientalis TaxID=649198 RepID=A0AAE3VRL1_9HYPH|nr:class I SAM-dependent methyltransferase [Amorphus orientalis]MDQ0317087.1 SAM-dependent methyltransferase [Amorphus orientalis]
MHLDAIEIRNFYLSPRGRIVRQLLSLRIREIWPDVRGQRLVGLGHATPFLRPFKDEAERVLGFMPAQQGVIAWPAEGPLVTSLVHDACLPLPDASVERVLLIHALEGAHAPQAMLRDVWRILAPGGRVLVVVANRAGLWSRVESTPFGVGRPFSRSQIARALEDLSFTPGRIETALHVPPSTTRFVLGSARGWDRMGSRVWPGLAGVVVVEAEKRLVQPINPGKKLRVPALVPALRPNPAPAPRSQTRFSGEEGTQPVGRTCSRTTTVL